MKVTVEITEKEKKVKSKEDELKIFEMKRDLRGRINELENKLASGKKDESIENELKILKNYLEKY